MSDNNSIFEPAIDKKVEISYDSLPNSSFEDVNLGGAKFSNVNLKEAVFDDVNMDETHFNKCGSNFLFVLFKQLLDIHAVDLQTVYLAIVYLNVCKVTVNEL